MIPPFPLLNLKGISRIVSMCMCITKNVPNTACRQPNTTCKQARNAFKNSFPSYYIGTLIKF